MLRRSDTDTLLSRSSELDVPAKVSARSDALNLGPFQKAATALADHVHNVCCNLGFVYAAGSNVAGLELIDKITEIIISDVVLRRSSAPAEDISVTKFVDQFGGCFG